MNVNEICRHLENYNEEFRVIRQRLGKANDRIASYDGPPRAISDGKIMPTKTDTGVFTVDASNLLEIMYGLLCDIRGEATRYEDFTGTNPPTEVVPGNYNPAARLNQAGR